MSDRSEARITDPVRIRALAHPLRLELIDILTGGPATATECAGLTGESVASCSFHLRSLAKYGFVEAADRRGRERPWRLLPGGLDIRPSRADPDSVRAVEVMAQVYVEHAVEHIRARLARLSDEPEEWIQASTITGYTLWVTPDELRDVSATLQSLSDPFKDRDNDPETRPPGAERVRLFAAAHRDAGRTEAGPTG